MRRAVCLLALLLAGCSGPPPPATSDPPPAIDDPGTTTSTSHRIEYQVTGTATHADLTYYDGAGGTQQVGDSPVPLATPIAFQADSGAFLSISAQNKGASGTVTCAITVDGTATKTATSTGAYVIASCEATVP